MPEGVKFLGGLMIIVGLGLLFVVPPLGLLLLVLAAIIGVVSVIKTREKRHAEIVDAARTGGVTRAAPVTQAPVTPEPSQPEARDRLTQLERLRTDGLVSDEEYEEKRKQIVDEL